MRPNSPPRPLAVRATQTEQIIRTNGSDVERWRDPTNLATAWDSRAQLAASFIPAGSHVVDIGAGAMALRSSLAEGCNYTPADIVVRAPGCLKVDLNAGEYPEVNTDWTTLLGVLEYIHAPADVLRAARTRSRHLIVSYVCHTRGAIRRRRGMGWVNDYTRNDFAALLHHTGWRIDAERVIKLRWRTTERLFVCSPADEQDTIGV